MTKTIRNLSIWTLIMHLLILIGAGHGVGPLGIFELFPIIHLDDFFERLSFSFSNSYDQLLPVAVLFSIIGQILMLFSFAAIDSSLKVISILFAMAGMYLGVFYLSVNCRSDSASMLSFITALPFIILSVGLLVITYKQLKADDEQL